MAGYLSAIAHSTAARGIAAAAVVVGAGTALFDEATDREVPAHLKDTDAYEALKRGTDLDGENMATVLKGLEQRRGLNGHGIALAGAFSEIDEGRSGRRQSEPAEARLLLAAYDAGLVEGQLAPSYLDEVPRMVASVREATKLRGAAADRLAVQLSQLRDIDRGPDVEEIESAYHSVPRGVRKTDDKVTIDRMVSRLRSDFGYDPVDPSVWR